MRGRRAGLRPWRVAFAGAVATVVGCSLVNDIEDLEGTGAILPDAGAPEAVALDAGADNDGAPTLCPLLPSPVGYDGLCSKLQQFTGTQRVDGADEEFCNLPAAVFFAAMGQGASVVPAPASVNARVIARAGADAMGFHAHIHVDETPVTVPTSSLSLGDSIELYVSASSAMNGLFGYEHGADPGVEIVASANAAELLTKAGRFVPALGPELFAGRLVPGGYEVELFLPWPLMDGDAGAPRIGSGIALELGINVHLTGDGGSDAGHFQSYYHLTKQDAGLTGTTCPGPILPFCDDRSWCRAFLQ